MVLNRKKEDRIMLEIRTYKFVEIAAYLHVNSSRGVRDKLTRYNVDFIEGGGQRDQTKTYTITAIHDPFKLFCVFDLEISPQTDFRKLRDFTYFLLADDNFNWRPAEMKEEYLRRLPHGPSRQTISKYQKLFTNRNLMAEGEFVYYRVYKDRGVQKHEIVTKAEYSAAWALYWDWRSKGECSDVAFSAMYTWFRGIPRKHPKMEKNAFFLDTLSLLEQYATDSFLAEYGEKS